MRQNRTKEVSPRVALVGPTGVGYELTGLRYPKADSGVVCTSSVRTVVWDAPLVSRLLRAKLPKARLLLVGNRLGNSEDGRTLGALFVKEGIEYRPVGSLTDSLPGFDVVFNGTDDYSRTWFSSINLPSIHNCVAELAALAGPKKLNAIYLDYWYSMPELVEVFEQVRTLCDVLYINLGDCDNMDNVLAAISLFGHEDIYVQASSKISLTHEFERLDRYRKAGMPKSGAFFLLTAGGNEALVLSHENALWIPVAPLHGMRTTGAGANVSATMLLPLVTDKNYTVNRKISLIRSALAQTSRAIAKGGPMLRRF